MAVEVEEMVLAGQIEEVARYCESDVLNTYRAWLVYELFRGSITAKETSEKYDPRCSLASALSELSLHSSPKQIAAKSAEAAA
jgi:hypothetical protein